LYNLGNLRELRELKELGELGKLGELGDGQKKWSPQKKAAAVPAAMERP
jgi:hypothetical protein